MNKTQNIKPNFKSILIPISSEYFSKEVLRRSVKLAEKFEIKINLIYIIEEKTLNQADKRQDSLRTSHDIDQTKNAIINEQKKSADNIIFEQAKNYLIKKKINFNAKIVKGEFSKVIKKETDKNIYELVLMSFAKECVLKYRLLDELKINVPVWIEEGGFHNTILAVCSNLAPNQKVPMYSMKLAESLDLKLKFLYIVDIEDSVEVDKKGQRSKTTSQRDLMENANDFSEKIKEKGYPIKIVKGGTERQILKAASKINNPLIIIGRSKKRKGLFGIPIKKFKKRLVEKCDHTIIFLN